MLAFLFFKSTGRGKFSIRKGGKIWADLLVVEQLKSLWIIKERKSNMKKILPKTEFIALIFSFLLLFSLAQVQAKTINVNCKPGKTIQAAVDNAEPGDVIKVKGTCNENVVIREEVHRITLDGQGTARIEGADPTTSTVRISGKGITIKGFTITGVRGGISVSRGEAIIEGNTIKDTGGSAVSIANHSFAQIIANTIKDSLSTGVVVSNTSSARIGYTGNPDARVPRPNTITGNRNGIDVRDTAVADIGFNTISDNTQRGVRVRRGSSARLGDVSRTEPSGNLIQNNGRDGIQVVDSTAQVRGNTITNNGRAGIVLRASSAVIGLDDGDPDNAVPNTISNNGQDRTRSGIDIGRVSLAVVTDNVIEGNSGDGITLAENSGLNLSGNSTDSANKNGDVGLDCTIGAYASGSIGTLTETSGATSFDDGTCIDDL